MKKLIAILLLLIFTSDIASFAGEATVIRSNGQAMYENEDSKTDVVKSAVTNLSTEANSINIKNLDKNNPDIIKYHNRFRKYSRNDVSIFHTSDINKELKGYKYYNYPQKDNFDLNDKNIIRVELQDGDYAILNNNIKGKKKYKYAAEYHKDGSLFGIVQIKTINKSRKTSIIQFCEYRYYKEYKERVCSQFDVFKFNHVMFFDIKKIENKIDIAQFIYKRYVDLDYLLCCQINDDLYVEKESKNLIVKMKSFDIPSESMNPVIIETFHYILLSPLFLLGLSLSFVTPFSLLCAFGMFTN